MNNPYNNNFVYNTHGSQTPQQTILPPNQNTRIMNQLPNSGFPQQGMQGQQQPMSPQMGMQGVNPRMMMPPNGQNTQNGFFQQQPPNGMQMQPPQQQPFRQQNMPMQQQQPMGMNMNQPRPQMTQPGPPQNFNSAPQNFNRPPPQHQGFHQQMPSSGRPMMSQMPPGMPGPPPQTHHLAPPPPKPMHQASHSQSTMYNGSRSNHFHERPPPSPSRSNRRRQPPMAPRMGRGSFDEFDVGPGYQHKALPPRPDERRGDHHYGHHERYNSRHELPPPPPDNYSEYDRAPPPSRSMNRRTPRTERFNSSYDKEMMHHNRRNSPEGIFLETASSGKTRVLQGTSSQRDVRGNPSQKSKRGKKKPAKKGLMATLARKKKPTGKSSRNVRGTPQQQRYTDASVHEQILREQQEREKERYAVLQRNMQRNDASMYDEAGYKLRKRREEAMHVGDALMRDRKRALLHNLRAQTWTIQWSEEFKKPYYHNRYTGESTWQPPEALLQH